MRKSPPNTAAPRLAHSDFFVFRTPLLPVDELVDWADGMRTARLREAGADRRALEAAWTEDVGLLRRRLGEILERAEVLHALYVASLSLQPGIEHWKRAPDGKKGLQAERALVRYFARMCARATPFGVFSGCSRGRIGEADEPTCLELEPRSGYCTVSRLDFEYLFALTTALRCDPAVAADLPYRPNSSLRRIGEVWHYVESRLTGEHRSHHLVKVENDPYLAAAVARAGDSASVGALVEAVLAVPDDVKPTPEEAREFVLELVANDVLVPTLSPLVTGESPLDEILRQLESIPSGRAAVEPLRRVRDGLTALDMKGLGRTPAEYEETAASLAALPARVDVSKLYQVDMLKPAPAARLGRAVVEELERGVDILCRFGPAGEPAELKAFREAFVQRYESALVPLPEALDEETGIGFGRWAPGEASPLLRGLGLLGRPAPEGAGSSPDTPAVLLRKVLDCAPALGTELELDAGDLPPASRRSRVPPSFNVSAVLVARSSGDVDSGDFRLYVRGGGGPSGARLFGRFCHADPQLEAAVRSHLRQEEALDPDAVYAEIVHLPEGRVGNVLSRPVLREFEICYLGRSGAAPDRQLPVDDLLVGVERSRIVLYSQRLRRRVVPRLTNAHGYVNPQLSSVYRFLCHLQGQDGAGVPGFSWGSLDALLFLPRLRCGRIVLSLARWRLSKDDIEGITKPMGSARFLAVQDLRERRRLPRWVLLQEGDHALPTDLDNPLSVDALVHVLKRASSATLTEMYPSPDELCAVGPEGRFCHELNVPFVAAAPADRTATESPAGRARTPVALATSAAPRHDRTFAPGGDWLYVKVYAGGGTLDEVLKTAVCRVVQAALDSGAAQRWFFLRYADPHEHLRLRFGGEPVALHRDVLPLLYEAFQPFVRSGRVWKVQLDTYEREIERYGGLEGAAAAEDVFCADSDAVLAILQGLAGDEGLDVRWRLALCGLDGLLSDFGFDLEARRAQAARWREAFQRELGGGAAKRQLGDRFRVERQRLEMLLWRPEEHDSLAFAWRALERRSARWLETARRLNGLAASGRLHTEVPDLVSSYAHMHVNRLIRSAARAHEAVLYDFLHRLYDARIASASRRERVAGRASAAAAAD
jgi:thiopeptide-type bacteriocin biosynthesis protein